MVRFKTIRLLFTVTLFFLISCKKKQETLSPAELSQWCNSEESGLIKSKVINNVKIVAKFVPPEYLAYKEYLLLGSQNYDSILTSYKCGSTFQISLSAEAENRIYSNLIYYKLRSNEEFSERTKYLNFNIAEFISLTDLENRYTPVLSNFEGYNQIGNSIHFHAVFIVPGIGCNQNISDDGIVKLSFSDPYWDLGTINFEFLKTDILNIPKLRF